MHSIHSRLLLVASLVLSAFLGLGALALDGAFRNSIESGMQQRLLQQVYVLLGAAQTDDKGRMRLPAALPDPRLETIDSGRYAMVSGSSDGYRWQSRSLLGRPLELTPITTPGESRYDHVTRLGEPLYRMHYAISWEDDLGRSLPYTILVAESTAEMQAQIDAFRARLLYWLGGVSLLLLIAQGAVLTWGLRPLRRIPLELQRVESGEKERIDGTYPRELSGLIASINNLIRTGRASRDRYRNSLGDLAHSLKTPLSLLRTSVSSVPNDQVRRLFDEQVTRMDDIVRYQLRRAASSTAAAPGQLVSVLPLVERLRHTLDKVYRDKSVDCRIESKQPMHFVGDESDLMEVIGNLLENAYKYCRSRVVVVVKQQRSKNDQVGEELQIVIEDDGPGIAPECRDEVRQRGVRADRRLPGQGIGLSLAAEIVALYEGRLQITAGALGGARISVSLPAR